LWQLEALWYRDKIPFDAVAELSMSVVFGKACNKIAVFELCAVGTICLDATDKRVTWSHTSGTLLLWVETEAEDNICAAHTSVKDLDLYLVGCRCADCRIDDRHDFGATSGRELNFADGGGHDEGDGRAESDGVNEVAWRLDGNGEFVDEMVVLGVFTLSFVHLDMVAW